MSHSLVLLSCRTEEPLGHVMIYGNPILIIVKYVAAKTCVFICPQKRVFSWGSWTILQKKTIFWLVCMFCPYIKIHWILDYIWAYPN